MCHPVNKSIVKGYILFIIQITVALRGFGCNTALLRTQEASPFCSYPSECHITGGVFQRAAEVQVWDPVDSPAFLPTFDMPFAESPLSSPRRTLREKEPRAQIACNSLQPLSVTAVP